MATEIKVPELGESVNEARVGRWLKKQGDPVRRGEVVVELETDKVDLEVGADDEGVLSTIEHEEGADVQVGDVLGRIEPGEAKEEQPSSEREQKAEKTDKETAEQKEKVDKAEETRKEKEPEKEAKPEKATKPEKEGEPQKQEAERREREERRLGEDEEAAEETPTTPAAERATTTAKRMAEERQVDLEAISGSGDQGRITKRDVEQFLADQETGRPERPGTAEQPEGPERPERPEREEERVPMSGRRRTIARRLVEAQRTAAILTTFNEVDMTAVQDLRRRYSEPFQEEHGTRLGIVSFFIKAAIGALKRFPRLNSELDGEEIVLKHYYDIGVAVGASEGLVVPVIHDADKKSMIELEKSIKDLAQRAEDSKLTVKDLQGGTFTITNGGVFGSLLSTPILNPPQVAILGLHKIEQRPYVIDGEIRVRPLMYVALSYDHRVVDGREAVQFLVRLKDLVEEPSRLAIEG